jgi:carotenoid cleavage dioxygenase-like enzyme
MPGFIKIQLGDSNPGELTPVKVEAFLYGEGLFGGEVVFAPRKNCSGEDDGYLTTYVFNSATSKSEFWVFDAKNPAKGPIAKVKVPGRIPYGFHGKFLEQEMIEHQNLLLKTTSTSQ